MPEHHWPGTWRRTILSQGSSSKENLSVISLQNRQMAGQNGAVPPHQQLTCLLANYQDPAPDQRDLRARFEEFANSSPNVFERHHPPGHFTASCWLLSPDQNRVLLTQHKKLGRWLQLGGHADGDTDLIAVALREAQEESGLSCLGPGSIEPEIFDLDAHWIPARANDPEHIHWDVRFVIHAASERFNVSAESDALAWVDIGSLAQDDGVDHSLRRMALKWLARDL
jgi:8-oxo-dGTP pyrophosphatase MutT (NUDIX family)